MLRDIIKACLREAPGVVAVISSAGSGKTYTLTSVYLALLLNGAKIDSILAVTFTNKAVEEMRIRILFRLMDIAFNAEEIDLFTAVLGLDKVTLQQRAYQLLKELVFDYSRFSIQTIDSFLNRLRLAFSLELGMSPYSQIRNSLAQDIELIIGLLLLKAEQDPSVRSSIHRFVNYFSQGLAVYHSWDPISYAQKIFLRYLEKESQLNYRLKPCSIKSIRPLAQKVLALRDEFLQAVTIANLGLSEKARWAIESLNMDSLMQVKDLTSRFFNRRNWDDFIGIFKKKSINGKDRAVVRCYDLWIKMLSALNELEIAFCENMPQPFVHIYDEFRQAVTEFQRRNDITYLGLIQSEISSLDPVIIAEKAVMRCGKYRYFLIDEFQDTSLAQWQSLYPIIEELLSQGGLLFCVGDPKQTIYRWRGSMPNMFSVLRSSFPAADYSQFVLSDNWRSAKEIVEFNNNIFSKKKSLLPLGKEPIFDETVMESVWSVFSPDMVCQNVKKDFPGKVEIVQVGIAEGTDSEEKRARLLSEMVSIVRTHRGEDLCILVRRRSEAQKVIASLLEAGIPVVSDESISLVSHPLIKALISLLRWLAYPDEAMYLYMFILSPLWAEVSGKTLLFWEKRLRFRSETYFVHLLEDVLKDLDQSSLYFMVKDIIERFNLYKKFPDEAVYLDGFLDLLWRWENENSSLLSAFLDYWKAQEDAGFEAEKLNLPADKQAVRVMTIHAAKGLEFDVVVMPFLEVDFLRRYSRGLHDQLFWELRHDNRLGIYYLNKTIALRNPILKKHYGKELAYQLWDNLNLIYVAFTRAKRELILLIPEEGSGAANTWAQWIKRAISRD